ncbi:MAG: hypothetical protein ACD_58C00212G0002, partial [uncultured bacterium]
MKLSLNWLKEFIDIKVTPDQLAQDLNSFGHEVEDVIKVGNDYILGISITANRGDCLSVLGMAREVAAMYNLKLKIIDYPISQINKSTTNKKINVKLKNKDIYDAFDVEIIENIKIKESPKWLQNKLKLVGIKPINNIVDITNFVMIETGQPIHAFDYNKINNGNMIIRLSKKSECIVTLDGKNRQLDNNSIIIEDGKKIFDLAGIMGGQNSQIDKNTKTIVMEGGVFNKKTIRATSKLLKLTTDASHRFERGVDDNNTCKAVDRASELVINLDQNSKIVYVMGALTDLRKSNTIDIDINRINNLLGTRLEPNQVIDYLSRLNIITDQQINKLTNQLTFNIPSYRKYDLTIWQDIAEEVARVHGYDKISKSLPIKTKSTPNENYNKKELLKDVLVENGFTEIYSYSFADEKLMTMLGNNLNKSRHVINSVTPELTHLRMDLLPSLLTAISKNPWAPEVKIFEIGKVFNDNEEKWQLGIAECNKNGQGIKQVLDKLNINSSIIIPDQKVLDHLKIRRPVRYVIIDLDTATKHLGGGQLDSCVVENGLNSTQEMQYKPISQFPPTIRDLAFIVKNDTDSEQIRSHILSLDPHILLAELFDEFNFPSAPSVNNQRDLRNMKNVAYHIWLQDLNKPMNPEHVDNITKQIIKSVESKFKAK